MRPGNGFRPASPSRIVDRRAARAEPRLQLACPASPVAGALRFADLDIDTSTPAGEMAANIIISGSQYERRLISQRTRDALAAKRARGSG